MQFVFEAAIQCSLEDDLAQISNKMRGAPGFDSAPNSGREENLSSRIERLGDPFGAPLSYASSSSSSSSNGGHGLYRPPSSSSSSSSSHQSLPIDSTNHPKDSKDSRKRNLVVCTSGKNGKNPDIEPGEEVDELPYKRPSRRGKHGQLLIAQLKAAGIKGADLKKKMTAPDSSKTISQETMRNLLVARRIVNAYNMGDLEAIENIIREAIVENCEICVFPFSQRLRGRTALMSMWLTLVEAFPNGIFRLSDTTINEDGELLTRFEFSGARQFDVKLHINTTDNFVEAGEIRPGEAAPDGKKGGGKGRGRKAGAGEAAAPASAPGEERPATVGGLFATDAPSNAWVEIDYSRQLLDSGDLLFENAKEDKFRGCMVMHINKDHKIHRLDYHWKEHD